ncbi:MAG TPA: hypothetical protein VF193_08220 [Steroidobacter sp.]
MSAKKLPRQKWWLYGALVAALSLCAYAGDSSTAPASTPDTERDGQHDFDFEIGTWKTHVKLLRRPLSGSSEWVELEGTSVVRKIWDGRANLVELDVSGPTGRLEGLSLRLYNPKTRQWSLNYANSRVGTITPPVIGSFKNGRGEFYGQESLDGRPVFVRFIIECESRDLCHFEQAFSGDGGKSWEVNWIATDTRVKE